MPYENPTLKLIDRKYRSARFLKKLNDFIFELALHLAPDLDPSFANKLRQILTAVLRERNRVINGQSTDAKYFDQLRTYRAMTFLLTHWHIQTLDRKKINGQLWTRDETRVTRFLNASIEILNAGFDELETLYPKPSLLDGLAQRIWFGFYDVSKAEAERDAAAIKALFVPDEEKTAA